MQIYTEIHGYFSITQSYNVTLHNTGFSYTEDSSNVERVGGWSCGQHHPARHGLFWKKKDVFLLTHKMESSVGVREGFVCAFVMLQTQPVQTYTFFPFWAHNNVCISLKNQYRNAKDGSCHTGCSMHRNWKLLVRWFSLSHWHTRTFPFPPTDTLWWGLAEE